MKNIVAVLRRENMRFPPQHFDRCEVCFWTDNAMQFDDPDYRGGANPVSLNEARANFRKFGAFSEECIGKTRKPTEDELSCNSRSNGTLCSCDDKAIYVYRLIIGIVRNDDAYFEFINETLRIRPTQWTWRDLQGQ